MQIILETQKTPEQLAEICQMIGICPVGAMKCPFKDKKPCEKIQSCRGVTAETWKEVLDNQELPALMLRNADLQMARMQSDYDGEAKQSLHLACLSASEALMHFENAMLES